MAKPISEARRRASRENGQKSRGPRTSEGKNVSRLNALKHCAHATLAPQPILGGREFDLDLTHDSRLLYNSRGPLEDLVADAVKAAALNLHIAQMSRVAFLALLGDLDKLEALEDKPSREILAKRMRELRQRQQRASDRKDDSATHLIERGDRPIIDDSYLVLQAILRFPDILKGFDDQVGRAERELAGAHARAREMVLDGIDFVDKRQKALDRHGHSLDINESLGWPRMGRSTHTSELTRVIGAPRQKRKAAPVAEATDGQPRSEPSSNLEVPAQNRESAPITGATGGTPQPTDSVNNAGPTITI